MAQLSEHQLLLLDNLMYFPLSVEQNGGNLKDIIESYRNSDGSWEYERLRDGCSGGFESFNNSDLKKLFDELYADSKLMSLRTTYTINENIQAACFVDNDGDATVAFRGTGGLYWTWRDNFEGLTVDNDDNYATFDQRTAARFINSLPYDNITVTGHSKGGNMAMYVTVILSDKIARCVSFDGQGFNNEFCKHYADQISKVQSKITAICAENDFVNVLMHSIAGKQIYVKLHDGIGFFDNHSHFYMYFDNKDGWNIVNKPGWGVSLLHDITLLLDKLPVTIGGLAGDALGLIVAAFISKDTTFLKMAWDIVETIIDYKLKGFSALWNSIREAFASKGIKNFSDFINYIKSSDNPVGSAIDLVVYVLSESDIFNRFMDIAKVAIVRFTIISTIVAIAKSLLSKAFLVLVGVVGGKVLLASAIVVAVVAAIVAVCVFVHFIIYHFDEIKAAVVKAFNDTVDAIKSVCVMVANAVKNAVVRLVTECIEGAKKLIESAKQFVSSVKQQICDKLHAIKNGILDHIKKGFATTQNAFHRVVEKISSYGREMLWVDSVRLKYCVDQLNTIARRVASIDSRLNSLYSKLKKNNIEQEEGVFTSLVNMYHLCSADINVDEGQALRRRARAISDLFKAFEKAEKFIESIIPRKHK